MKALLLLQLKLEVRKRSVIISLLLYLASLVFINYLTVGQHNLQSSPFIWSALFWIVLLSTLVNAIAKSFMLEKAGATTYLYSLADPGQIIASRILYGFLLCTAICLAGFVFFSMFLSNPIEDWRRVQPRIPTRADAIKALLEIALKAERQRLEESVPSGQG